MSEEDDNTATATATAAATGDEGDDDAPAEEHEVAGDFEPVVILEEVDVRSGEEEEEVLYAKRSKLFIFGETLLDKGTGTKSWRERGIGEVRLLRHREHGRIRLLMRQEKTMKVIANHAVDPRIKLEPNVGSDRSWVWSAFDFAEGELVETVFALRFGDSEIAKEFKEKFEQSQKDMETLLSGADTPGTDEGKAGEEAAELLAGLSTSEKPAEEGEVEKAE